MKVNLVLLTKSGSPRKFSVENSITVIGRRKQCDLRIPLATVSKKHCQLKFDNGSFKIRDLKSRNGTKVNGEEVEETAIKAGDFIKIGPLLFVLQINGEPNKVTHPNKKKKPSQSQQNSQRSTENQTPEVSTEDIEEELMELSEEDLE